MSNNPYAELFFEGLSSQYPLPRFLEDLEKCERFDDVSFSGGQYVAVKANGRNFWVPGTFVDDVSVDHILKEVTKDSVAKQSLSNRRKSLEKSYAFSGRGRAGTYRFRTSMSVCEGLNGVEGYAITLRSFPRNLPTIHDIKFPSAVHEAMFPKDGLVLITGGTGSGKTTSMAANIHTAAVETGLLDDRWLRTYEDPIEYSFSPLMTMPVEYRPSCSIQQFEVGDLGAFEDWPDAVQHALRNNPDVIFFGELRSLEVIQNALLLAKSGHCVIGTIHVNNVVETISRIIDRFPSMTQQAMRIDLIANLRMVYSQRLLPTQSGGRVANYEYCEFDRISEKLLDAKEDDVVRRQIIREAMESQFMTFEQNLKAHYEEGSISKATFQKNKHLGNILNEE